MAALVMLDLGGVFMETFEHTGCAMLARGFIFILFIFFLCYIPPSCI